MSKLVEGLNDRQKEAVYATEGPVLVLAGAGSGKTKTLTHRIAYILEQNLARPSEILAITFTNKAAREMQERITSLVGDAAQYIWIKTFHSACLRILRRDIDKIGYTSNFTIYDTSDQKRLIKDCIVACNLNEDMYPVKSAMARISSAKDELVSPKQYAEEREGNFREEGFAKIYTAYQNKLFENNALDFDDLIVKTIELLRNNPDIAEYYQEKFKYILVDEYQDTNNAQYALISILAGKHRNLCVVGDDDQSIYKFRGANIRNILDFEKQFKDAKNIKLEQNYRSTQNILDAANAVISNNSERKSKSLWTDLGEGDKITLKSTENQIEEAMYISNEIEKLVASGDYKYSDIAILYRTNAQTRAFEDNLMCPYRVLSGLRFYDTKEIKDILAYLRVINNPHDDINLKRIINVPKRGIGDTTVGRVEMLANGVSKSMFEIMSGEEYFDALGKSSAKLKEFADMINKIRADVPNIKVSEVVDRVLNDTGYINALVLENTIEARGRIENVEELKSKAVEYEENVDEPSFEGFLDNISLVSDVDNYDENQDAIVLMTLHSAKGLEFPVVFMCGMENGLFPSYQSMYETDELEEERRLCYVGITRAKKKLYMTYAKLRTVFGKTESKMISDFVHEIPNELIHRIAEPKKEQINSFGSSYGGSFGTSYQGGFGSSYASDTTSYSGGFGGAKKPTLDSVLKAYNLDSKPSSSVSYSIGDAVSHKKFGEGIIIGINDASGDSELKIDFKKFGVRTLMASYARLEKI